MTSTLRRCDLPSEYGEITRITNMVASVPTTAEEIQENDEMLPPGSILYRIAAVNEAGAMVGHASAYRYRNTKEGRFYINAAVEPVYWKHGIGTALLADVEKFAQANGGTEFLGQVFDRDAESLAYVKRHDYEVARHGFDSTLNVSTFDPGRFSGVVDGVAATGISFFNLADRPGYDTEQTLYAFMGTTIVDLPGYAAKEYMPFTVWRKWVVEGNGSFPEGVIVAVDGEQIVGVTILERVPDGLYSSHTSVDRAYRGRHIALALKLLAIDVAKRLAMGQMRTGNDSLNAPILAVNRKLGYVPLAGDYEVVKRV